MSSKRSTGAQRDDTGDTLVADDTDDGDDDDGSEGGTDLQQ